MVVPLGPGKFYGSSLPRPRIYTDVKLNDERVDPPVPVLDPLMSWAEEAHWSMGGKSFTRHRLQGRIEGNVEKLRAERERLMKKRKEADTADRRINRKFTPSPPPAPVAVKRRRYMALVDEDDEEDSGDDVEERENGDEHGLKKKKLARKLGDDFDRVAGKGKASPVKGSGNGSGVVALRTQSRKSDEGVRVSEDLGKLKPEGKRVKSVEENHGPAASKGTRTSPRLAKRGSS